MSIVAGIAFGSLFGALTSFMPERGDSYVVTLRFLVLFLSGLFALFVSNMIGWSGAGIILSKETIEYQTVCFRYGLKYRHKY